MDITWKTDNLSLARVEDILGKAFVAALVASPAAVAKCESRAQGAWEANDVEFYAAYRSLVRLIRENKV